MTLLQVPSMRRKKKNKRVNDNNCSNNKKGYNINGDWHKCSDFHIKGEFSHTHNICTTIYSYIDEIQLLAEQ